jgi:2-isopropylmalate synthase
VHGIFREEEWYRVRAVSLTSLAEQAGDVGLFSYVSSKKEMEEKIMMNYKKYQKQYFMPPVPCYDWVKKDSIDHAPVWCSVDLRDGNQALVIPMDLDTKIEFFKLLCKVGFKEIEVGFPAASETEYVFLRRLIEENLIPDDVTVQVLTQAREHIIRKTFQALEGCKNAIVHVYNSTSFAQRQQVFKKDKEEIKRIAVEGAELLQKLTEEENESYRFEYSPESFTGTEPEYALEVCNAVLDVWKPTADRKAIINLPSTVELSMPHVYASQVEYMSKNLKYRDNVVLSLHPHNDRGCGVSDAELGVLAGADRVEGTLFGNGERTGNVDIITLAMNLYMQGVNPEMNFDNMKDLVDRYEEYTGMQVGPRTPYCGSLVFAAFSGSHQDAIAKGMHWREEHDPDHWTVPYLPIDPTDIGRSYDADVIRINSQSGKGGVGYVLETHYDLILPKKMREAMGYAAKDLSDHLHKELKPDEIFSLFKQTFEDKNSPLTVNGVHFRQLDSGRIEASVNSRYGDGEFAVTKAEGNGRLDAVSNALKQAHGLDYTLTTYQEHALTKSSSSNAIAYVGIQEKNGTMSWGAAVDPDIIRASIDALVTAVNNR